MKGSPITSQAASSKSKGNRAGKASPPRPSGEPSHRPRRSLPSLPRTLPSNRSRGAENLQGMMEMGARPTPLAVPGAKPSPCQRERGQSHTCQIQRLPLQTPPGPKRRNPRALLGERAGDAALARPHRARPGGQGQLQEHRVQGTSWWSRILPLQRLLPDPRASPLSLCGATASHSWERQEEPLGVTALLGMPGGRIPPLTPTRGAVTSWLSSPMP